MKLRERAEANQSSRDERGIGHGKTGVSTELGSGSSCRGTERDPRTR